MAWKFDRTERLADLTERCERTMDYLRRDRCDRIGDARAIELIDARLSVLGRRQRRFQTEARTARRLARQIAQA